MDNKRHIQGFTLIEVLVALAVAGGLLGALVMLAAQYTRNVAHVEAQLAADVAARNLADRYRLQIPPQRRPQPVREEGKITQAGIDFSYRITPAATLSAELVQLTIALFEGENQTASRELVIYVPRPTE